jgi:transcriptional regulator NrdR family protein
MPKGRSHSVCPECDSQLRVVNTRVRFDGSWQKYRRYACCGCHKRFSSIEIFVTFSKGPKAIYQKRRP